MLLGVLFGALWGSAQSLLWLSVLALVTWTGDIRFFVPMHAAALAASATAMRFLHWRDAPTPQHRAEGLPEAVLTGMPRARVFTR